MLYSSTHRPRNVGAPQAAAILYGDWGTSKAYVIGLAFALAGHSSFWLILAVSVLMLLVGLNYIIICKHNPLGGGAYSSARKSSELLALMAAFFLISDYLVTASLSALSCFEYLGVMHPVEWAMGAIAIIGCLNYFGPKHSGNLALTIAAFTVVVVIILGIVSIPFVGKAVQELRLPEGGFLENWDKFVIIILALSGIESIANATGVMRLDVGSTETKPVVAAASKKAIVWVMIEVCFFTAFFGLVINAVPGLRIVDGQVNAPDVSGVRDYMLRYMGDFFVSQEFNPLIGKIFGSIIAITFGILLLSAVNTAIITLTSLLFVMSRDGEMPENFQKLTPFGVPVIPLIIGTIVPIIILAVVGDIKQLANLYAIGFVGAIAINIGANALDTSIPASISQRVFMFFTFVIMSLIEITLFLSKPDARRFVLFILLVGLILRAFVAERRKQRWSARKVKLKHASLYEDDTRTPLHHGAMMCAVRGIGKTLNFALQEAKHHEQPLYILYIREQKVITEDDKDRIWLDDPTACEIFDYAKESSHEMPLKFFYLVSDSTADSIVNMARELRVSRLIIGKPRQNRVLQILRGNVIQDITEILPSEIDLLVIS